MNAVLSRALLLTALAASLSGCPSHPDPPRRVFLITVDTLRADHLGAYGYRRNTSPYLDTLAKKSVLFERAIVQWPKTGPSFASMFTGQYPQTTGFTHKADIRIRDEYLTLPEFFAGRGYRTVAVNSNGVLNSDLGWNAGFDEFLETRVAFGLGLGTQVSYRGTMNALKVNELALPLLEKHAASDRLFAWIHYSDPHTPYLLPEGFGNPFLGDPYFTGKRLVELENPEAVEIEGQRELRFYVAQYDANILVVDRAIERLMARLGELGLLADALVIVTADHGESLGEHDYYLEHGRLPYNPTLHVPLFVYRTDGQGAGRRIAEPVELLDLYPTLRELVAPRAPVAGLEGKSLAALLGGEGPSAEARAAFRYAFSGAGGGSPLTHYRSVQDSGWQLVFHPPFTGKKGDLPAKTELYDLTQDPLAAHDLAATDPERTRRMMQVLAKWMDGRLWISPPKGLAAKNSEDTLKALKALGYVN